MCGATVRQVADNFVPGTAEHRHPAEPNTTTVHQIRAAVMEEACASIFRPAGETVSTAMRKHLDSSKPYPSLSKPAHLARAANPHRQKERPGDPTACVLHWTLILLPRIFYKMILMCVANVTAYLLLLPN